MWRQGPIWEPKDSRFRPYSITTLIFFYLGKLFGRLFRKRMQEYFRGSNHHVVEERKRRKSGKRRNGA